MQDEILKHKKMCILELRKYGMCSKASFLIALSVLLMYAAISVFYLLNSGNACYCSVQSLLSSRLLSRNLKVKIYKTIILPLVLYGCETWSLTLREEHRLRVFENRVLRRIFGPKRDEVMGERRKLHSG
jgi:hypothetical protein